MGEIGRIVDLLDRAFQGDAWHGPAVREILVGLNASQAAARPLEGGHTIWELVLHMTVWKDEVRRRIEGETPRSLPPAEDWPTVGRTDEPSWRAALDDLASSHARLRAVMAQVLDRQLDGPLGGDGGTVWTVYTTVHGVIQHDLYHAGQIAILRKSAVASTPVDRNP